MMTNETRAVLDAIRRRDKALGPVASRAQAEAALDDCRTLLEIIDELQTVKAPRTAAPGTQPFALKTGS